MINHCSPIGKPSAWLQKRLEDGQKADSLGRMRYNFGTCLAG
jgi:hypothetical protein